MKPLVSVIITCYNHRATIEKAMESVLMQEVSFPYEILVGDDASLDGSAALLRQYADLSYVRLFLRRENVGASRNLYDLQCHAIGQYLAYLDGDDYWTDSRKLQKQVKFLEENPTYVGCTSFSLIVDQAGTPVKRQRISWVPRKRRFTLRDFKGIYLPGQIGTLLHRNDPAWRADLAVEVLHPIIADRALFLSLLSKGMIRQIPERLCAYRVDRGKESATDRLYRDNPDYVKDDYLYTKRLEGYARAHHRPCSFSAHKRHLFVSAFYLRCRYRDRTSKELLQRIARDGCPLFYWLYLPFGILHKIFRRTMIA